MADQVRRGTGRWVLALVLCGLLAVGVTVVLVARPAKSAAPATVPTPTPSAAGPTATPSVSPSGSPTGSAAPAAPTPRPSPSSAPPTPLDILALGDSVTAGSKCDCDAFPRLYATDVHARTGDPVRLSNEGQPGATSADVLTYLRTKAGAAAAGGSNVIMLTIGANDFTAVAHRVLTQACGGSNDLACTATGLAGLGDNLAAITNRLHALRGDQPTMLLFTDYWNVFEDGDVADADYSSRGQVDSDRLTRAVNTVIKRSTAQGAATFVDLYEPFKGRSGDRDPTSLLADDGDHPNAAGHRVIADALLSAGLGKLGVSESKG